MSGCVNIVGAGLAGSEAALRLAGLGVKVNLFEMRPVVQTDVHHTGDCAELVCSNSLKSTKPTSAAGMLKDELVMLGSPVFSCALQAQVPAGGALAVDRVMFSTQVTELIENHPLIDFHRVEVKGVTPHGDVLIHDNDRDVTAAGFPSDCVILASGPLTSNALADFVQDVTGRESMAFYDAAAPIVMADSLDYGKLFRQSRYEEGDGDYLNAPMNRDEYDKFIDELLAARRVIAKDFETRELFQACQPIEEIARKGKDAPRFGTLKPVGLIDPRTGRRPWAALQLRAEDAAGQSYNLVGFQTNLAFPEQERVFRLIPGLEHAEFARYGVMHRNTFVDAPMVLDERLILKTPASTRFGIPILFCGQLSGTEGYCEAIRSGAHAAISVAAMLQGIEPPSLPRETVFGSLIAYATSANTVDYQPMHVNFGILEPLDQKIRNKQERYTRYAERGKAAFLQYVTELRVCNLLAANVD
ncbi:MAG: methylenetetrahydrofolate--tRNA-(uracil(54)-C(5))-methyltransferase (FADH(2)-oxidizing) TrmFO [Eggerthellaceae bacterium]|nr:methylenetetrahydrofolate--tRNA-(uracil(54)-C(5))-methyltransferase (FADH(2)-oxidizing) TrmFO [Eggerthellaceae bacterium]